MKKINQIAVGLFVVNNTAFDLINVPNSTKLSIMYFSLMYFSLFLICLGNSLTNKKFISFDTVLGLGFIVRVAWELSKWNLNFNEYITSVNNYEKGLLLTFFTISLLIIPLTNDRFK